MSAESRALTADDFRAYAAWLAAGKPGAREEVEMTCIRMETWVGVCEWGCRVERERDVARAALVDAERELDALRGGAS